LIINEPEFNPEEICFDLTDKGSVQKLINSILHNSKSYKSKPSEVKDRIDLAVNDEKFVESITTAVNKRLVFVAGSVAPELRTHNSEEHDDFYWKHVFWNKFEVDSPIHYKSFLKKYKMALEAFVEKLSAQLKEKKFVVSSCHEIECVGKHIIELCVKNDDDYHVEGVYQISEDTKKSLKKLPEKALDKFYLIQDAARLNYLINKDGLIIIAGGEGTSRDYRAYKLLCAKSTPYRNSLRLLTVPCFGGAGLTAWLAESQNQPTVCSECINSGKHTSTALHGCTDQNIEKLVGHIL
jgi:hypothetical protein